MATEPPPQSFDGVAAVYDDTQPVHVVEHYLQKRVAFALRTFPPGARLLDVGCGTGRLSERLRAAGFKMTGLDNSLGMLTSAHARGLAVVRGTAAAMPWRDGTFDGTISVAVMHHLRTPELVRAAIGEMVRVTRRGGRAVVWDHSPVNPYWYFYMRRIPQDDGSERLVPKRELIDDVRAAGGRLRDAVRLGFMPDFMPRRCTSAAAVAERVLEALPFTRWIAAHNVVVAEKP